MDIRSKVVSALRWTAAARGLGQLASWLITIFVIRLLTPEDYGLMAMAMVVISFLILLNTYGFDALLVQEKKLTEALRREVFGAVIVINSLFFALLMAGAPMLAEFYGEPALTPVLQVLAFQFLLLIFETLPQSQLERDIEFSRRAVVDLTTVVAGSVTTLALALLDYGVWALVWGAVLTNATRMLGLNLISRNLVWPSFSVQHLRAHFAFGSFITADRGLWYVFSESDKFIGGKLLGSQALGYYAVANQLAALPIHKISGLLNSVAFPAFSRTHADAGKEKVRDYLLKSTHLLALAAFPVFFGMSCVAYPLIASLLGDKWLPAAPLLQLLGLIMPLRLLSNIFPPMLWGMGVPKISATNFAIAALLMTVAFLIGAQWGAIGLAIAWLAGYPLVFAIKVHRACRQVSLAPSAYYSQMLRPALASSIMYATVTVIHQFVANRGADVPTLALLMCGGVLVYCTVAYLIDRKGFLELSELVRN